ILVPYDTPARTHQATKSRGFEACGQRDRAIARVHPSDKTAESISGQARCGPTMECVLPELPASRLENTRVASQKYCRKRLGRDRKTARKSRRVAAESPGHRGCCALDFQNPVSMGTQADVLLGGSQFP